MQQKKNNTSAATFPSRRQPKAQIIEFPAARAGRAEPETEVFVRPESLTELICFLGGYCLNNPGEAIVGIIAVIVAFVFLFIVFPQIF